MNKKISDNKRAFIQGDEMPMQLPKVDSDDSIESMFRNEQNAMQDNVKELFHEDKVKARTDLSTRQIKLITKAFYLAKMTGMKEIHAILYDFMTLSISKDRKSRQEYVEGLKSRIQDSMMSAMGNTRGQFGR